MVVAAFLLHVVGRLIAVNRLQPEFRGLFRDVIKFLLHDFQRQLIASLGLFVHVHIVFFSVGGAAMNTNARSDTDASMQEMNIEN